MAVPRKLVIAPNAATRELWRIAESGDLDELEGVLPQADINARNEHGMTALMRAANHGRVQMVRVLLELGADPNLARNDNFTALSLAAFFGHAEVVEMLMRHGANTNVATRFGTSPYEWARARSFAEVARSLAKRSDDRKESVSSVAPTELPPQPGRETQRELDLEPEFEPASPSEPIVVRTLKDPPEIWDLVQEAPRNFDARSAFMARMGSIKAAFVIALTLFVVIGAAAGAVFVFKDNLPSTLLPASSGVSSPTAAVTTVSTPGTTQAAPIVSAPTESQPAATDNALAETPPINRAEPTTSEINKPNIRRSRSLARARAISNDVNNEAATTQTNTTPPAVAVPRVESRASAESEAKKSPAPVNQPMIAPPKSSQPKAKVIQWP